MKKVDNTYPITEEQKAILNNYRCERLSSDLTNLQKIMNFHPRKEGGGLLRSLQNEAWGRDMRGTTAYYVVKNPEGRIVMFFSLKCGTLFDALKTQSFMESYKDSDILKKWQPYKMYRECRDNNDMIGAMRYKDGAMAFMDLQRKIGRRELEELDGELDLYAFINSDDPIESNKLIIRVEHAYSAIELVDFCTDVSVDVKTTWKKDFPHQRMGETLFWHFLVPKLFEIGNLIGSEFVSLFAADQSADNKLVNYYEGMHFFKITKLGTVKPYYDMTCSFMGKRLRSIHPELPRAEDLLIDPNPHGLDYYRDYFFEHFNTVATVDDNI